MFTKFKKKYNSDINEILDIQNSTVDLMMDLYKMIEDQRKAIRALEESVEQLQRLALKAEL